MNVRCMSRVRCIRAIITGLAAVFVSLGASTGCATGRSPAATRIQEADSNMVAGCTYLGEVSGTSGWGGLAASTGIENAKNQALDQAAKKGATHVVWNNLAGGWSPSVSGKAYRCPEPR